MPDSNADIEAPAAPTAAPEQLFARLRPYNPQAGYTVKTHMLNGTMWTGGTQPRWRPVSAAQAADLRDLVQNPCIKTSPPLFEIRTYAQVQQEMAQIEARRRRDAGLSAGIDPEILDAAPGAVTTSVLPQHRRRGAAIPEAAVPVPAAIPAAIAVPAVPAAAQG